MDQVDLPQELQKKIEIERAFSTQGALSLAGRQLSERYRSESLSPFPRMSKQHTIAYALSRMPATYAALCAVAYEMHLRTSQKPLNSLLDIGSGTGAGLWAFYPHLSPNFKATCLERDKNLIALAKNLAPSVQGTIEWLNRDAAKSLPADTYDIVLLAYSLGEMPKWEEILHAAWQQTKQLLILVGPGTPKSFAQIKQARHLLLQDKAHLLAPCPNQGQCPMQDGDWCHFSQRTSRSALHKALKGGHLSYEDEKYAYLIASKSPGKPAESRILRHPIKRTGHIQFRLCTESGLIQKTISKRDKSLYVRAKKWNWGDESPSAITFPMPCKTPVD